MKAELKFEFDLDEPEDRLKLKELSTDQAAKLKIVLGDLAQYLRNIVKYSSDTVHDEYIKCADETRIKLFEFLNTYDLNIDE